MNIEHWCLIVATTFALAGSLLIVARSPLSHWLCKFAKMIFGLNEASRAGNAYFRRIYDEKTVPAKLRLLGIILLISIIPLALFGLILSFAT